MSIDVFCFKASRKHSNWARSISIDRFFASTGVRGVPEENDYAVVDAVFCFMTAFLDCAIGYGDNSRTTTVCML